MKSPFKNSFRKCCAGVLATGLLLTGPAGITKVQAAENQAMALPIEFIGVSDRFGAQGESSSRCHFSGGSHVDTLSDNYTYSYTCYIPKAVFNSPGSTVNVDSWLDVQTPSPEEGQDDIYLGSMRARYNISLIYEKGQVKLCVEDTENDWNQVDPSTYASYISMDTTGDLYRLTVKDAPVPDKLYDENDDSSAIDTSQTGYPSINISITGTYNQIATIAYIDNVNIKAAGKTVLETDCSPESLEELGYHDYVIAEKDETCVERPAPVDLNTSLLTLSKTSGKVKVGKTLSIKASAAASGTITYTSSNKKIATVNASGTVKGIKAGTANITVSANGVSKTFKVTVKK